MAFFSRFFGNSVSTAAGVAIGGAVTPTLNPLTQKIANETWQLYPDVPVPVIVAILGVAQGQIDKGAAQSWAAEQGFGGPQFDAMLAAADEGPGVAQAFDLWRRGAIDDGGFRTALKREAIEDQWIGPLMALKRRLLSPAELANAVVQGFKTEPEAAKDAALQGYDAADFQTMVDVTGLPPGPETLLDWLRRGIITDAELQQGIKEGHTKVKYIPFYEQARARVLSAAEYATAHLKGHATQAEMYAGGALTGYTPAQMDLLFVDRGRPATAHQIHIGYARGAKVDGTNLNELDAIAAAVKQSDIRPEYTSIIQAQRYTMPSAFVLRALVSDGTFTAAQGEAILVDSGWVPAYAQQAAQKWAGSGATGAKAETKAELATEYEGGYITEAEYRAALTTLGYTGTALEHEVHMGDARRVGKYREHAIAAIQKSYVGHTIDAVTATADLAAAGVTGEAAALLLPLWDLERRATVRHLTNAQIRAAYRKSVIPQATAVAQLEENGMTATDAATYLAS